MRKSRCSTCCWGIPGRSSPIAGTTRDTVGCGVRGIPVVFIDTAGLRGAEGEAVEREGVREKPATGCGGRELVLHVLDGSGPLIPNDAT